MVHFEDLLVLAAGLSASLSAAAAALAYLRTRERPDAAGRAFVVLTTAGAAWAAAFGLQVSLGTTPAARALVHVQGAMTTVVVTGGLLFGVYYSNNGEWLTPERLALVSAPPVSTLVVVAANPGGLFFAAIEPVTVAGAKLLVARPGPLMLAHTGYALLVGFLLVYLLVGAAARSTGTYRPQALSVGAAGGLVVLATAGFLARSPVAPAFDTTPLAFGGSSLLCLFAMYRYDLFDVVPVARATVFERMADAIVVVGERERVLETNPAAREAFGLADDGVGRPVEAVLPDTTAVERLLTGERAEVVVEPSGPAATDGGHPEPRHYEATSEALGREGLRLLVFRDVTDRTRLRRRYQAYVEHADDVVAVADADGVLEYVSPAVEGVLDLPAGELEGEVLTDFVHPDDVRAVAAPLAESLETPGERVRMTFRARHRDGGWRTLAGAGVNRFDDPHVGGYLLTLRDATADARYEQRLRVLTRVLRHDLRNELNVVLGYAGVIAEDADDANAERATHVHRAAERLASLGERVRGVNRTLEGADHGGRPVAVADVAADVADRAVERYPEADVRSDLEGTVGYGDELFATAVWNVLENAVQHHDGERPRVRLTARRDGDAVEVRVADDGPGIPDEDRTAVESGHETQLRHASGLGLWLVRWILDGVDGELTFPDPEACEPPADWDRVGTVVALRLRSADPAVDPAGAGEQVDPWGVHESDAGRADGGDGEWRPEGHGDAGRATD